MAHPPYLGFSTYGVLRLVLVLMGVCLVGYTIGPPFYWRLKEHSTGQASCPCVCDCSSEEEYLFIPLEMVNNSFPGCGKHDPDTNEEMEKDTIDLLSEELNLQKAVANDALEHAKELIMDTRRASSHYQKEAEKCSAGIETCEEARERAERELVEELRLSELWENRAHEYGWRDNTT